MAHLRVLVVDDEDLILQVMKSFFLHRDDQCDVAANGVEALRLVEDRIYDLILSDISMPGMDGLELISRVKLLQPQTVCIVMSGLGTRRDIIAALKIGVFDFIDKPIPDLAALTMVVDRAAESGRLVRERDALLDNLREQNSKLEYGLLRLHEAFEQLRQQEEALESDLQKAQRVQRKFLPTGFPRAPGLDFYGYYGPCEQLGGDFFGTISLNDGRIALYLVDVAGHGVSAAMITVTFRELMRARRRSTPDDMLFAQPAEVLRYMNDALLEENFDPPIFVSMVYCVIDPYSGEVKSACAGHPAPIVVSGKNQALAVPNGGTVLGTKGAAHYTTTTLQLSPGDALLFYSDGLSEARNSKGNEFSTASLHEIMGAQHGSSAKAIAGELEQRLLNHLETAAPSDDITFFIVTRGTPVAAEKGGANGDIATDSVKIVMPEKLARARTDVHGQIHAGFRDKTCIVQLDGLMTWQMSPALREMLHQAKDRATPPFLIDLSACEAMDSTMLGLLLQQTAELVLYQPGKRVIGQLHEMGVLHLFTVSHDPCPQPQVAMAITPKNTQQACSDLILSAHEALMEASVSNRQKFKDVVDTLRHQKTDT
jgi:serine phosphatase RsbU (regulator of sigma subunit)/anti-anti-sigma regulatory factor